MRQTNAYAPDSDRWFNQVTPPIPGKGGACPVRDGLPDIEPVRAWSNFEFVADDGSINEVDLLVLTSKGLPCRIKSRPGIVDGDAMTWRWAGDHDGRNGSSTTRGCRQIAKRRSWRACFSGRRRWCAAGCRLSKRSCFCPPRTSSASCRGRGHRSLGPRQAATDRTRRRLGYPARPHPLIARGTTTRAVGASIANWRRRSSAPWKRRAFAARSAIVRVGEYQLDKLLDEGPVTRLGLST